MSIELINAVFKSKVKPATMRFVLLAMSDYANEAKEAYPSIRTIMNKTMMDRKTVQKQILELEKQGYIADTGRRVGATNSIKVWAISKDRIASSPKNGATPFLPLSTPKNGSGKLSQNWDTEPSVLLTTSEPPDQHVADEPDQPIETDEPVTPVTPEEPAKPAKPEKPEKPEEPDEPEEPTPQSRLAEMLAGKMIAELPTAKVNPESWAVDIERMLRIDKRTEQEAAQIINWIYHEGHFWIPNIRSGRKLREKYETMLLQMKRGSRRRRTKEFDNTDYTSGTQGFETNV